MNNTILNNIDNAKIINHFSDSKTNKHNGTLYTPIVSISHSNRKMGGATASVSLLTACTCSEKMPCYKDCYARRMENMRPSIYNSYLNNFIIYKKNPQLFFDSVLSAMLTSLYFRFFVSGDIPDIEFLKLAFETCKKAPRCRVLMFTKKAYYVNSLLESGEKMPENLVIIFSNWGDFKPVNPYNMPVSNVYNNINDIPKTAHLCGGDCLQCQLAGRGCWYAKNGDTIAFLKH